MATIPLHTQIAGYLANLGIDATPDALAATGDALDALVVKLAYELVTLDGIILRVGRDIAAILTAGGWRISERRLTNGPDQMQRLAADYDQSCDRRAQIIENLKFIAEHSASSRNPEPPAKPNHPTEQEPTMKPTRVTVTRTRRAITTQLRDHCQANGLSYECATQDRGQGPQLVLVIDGEVLTPRDAADKYLPGGWAGSYGSA